MRCRAHRKYVLLNDAITYGVQIDALGIRRDTPARIASAQTTGFATMQLRARWLTRLFIRSIILALVSRATRLRYCRRLLLIMHQLDTIAYFTVMREGMHTAVLPVLVVQPEPIRYNWQATADIRYMPVWRIYEKDYFGVGATNGRKVFHVYSFSLYYFYQNCWNIYTWPYQDRGLGDGSDGKADNRKLLQIPGYTGPTYITAGYVGPGSGNISVTNGSTTVNFSQSQTLVRGNWITVSNDPWLLRWYIVSGSGTGPYTIQSGVNPGATYQGPTGSVSAWVYGNAVDQDASAVSVRGQRCTSGTAKSDAAEVRAV